jgi:hypothetical protein
LFKFLLALALALGVASVAYGSAAWLDVKGGSVQAGDDYDLVCDEDGVRVKWDKYLIATPDVGPDTVTFKVDKVEISDISHRCGGATVELVLTCKAHDEPGNPGGPFELCGGQDEGYWGNVPVHGGSVVIDIEDLPVKLITDLHVAIVSESGDPGQNEPGCDPADDGSQDCPPVS